jgi:8-oxo-dGTP pyrophosphatase MutT (NUDIX family)
MPIPDFVARLRAHVGHDLLWLSSATAIVLDGRGRVLLGRRSDSGAWALPGGIVDPAEEPADAAVREVFEETGVVAVPERLIAVTVTEPFAYPNGDQVQYLDLVFRCRAVGGEPRVNDAESVEVGWHEIDSLPEVSELTVGFLSQARSPGVATDFHFSGVSAVLGDLRQPAEGRIGRSD